MADRKQDQPDTLAMLREAMGGDVLCNNTTGRYLSDHIEELIEARVQAAIKHEREAIAMAQPRDANNPITALSIEMLVAAGHVTREKADEAYRLACNAVRPHLKA